MNRLYINRAIRFHLAAEEAQDELAITQYQEHKTQLTTQLLELLEAIDVKLHIAPA